MSCNCVSQKKACQIKVLDSHHRVGGNVELQKTLYDTLAQKASTCSHCVYYLSSTIFY